MTTTHHLILILVAFVITFLNAYHEGNYEYRLYKDAFIARKRAKSEGVSFYQFAQDYINGKDISKVNSEKRVKILSLQRLFSQCPEFAEEYFNKEKFRHNIEFLELKSKWNEYDHFEQKKAQKENTHTLRDLLICEETQKDSLIKKIGSYLSAGKIKGKGVALLISALREKQYIAKHTTRAKIVECINEHFNIKIQRGYDDFLSGTNHAKQLKFDEIAAVIKQINIDNENSN